MRVPRPRTGRLHARPLRAAVLAAACWLLGGCGSDEFLAPAPCAPPPAVGDPNGHADPWGAKAAGEARAGRISDIARMPQPAHGRQPIEQGDFLLINEHLAVVIEDVGLSDGYTRFGGDILAIDSVDDDGAPAGVSRFNETLYGLGLNLPNPSSVTVLRDGSDGGEAVVRTTGPLETVPFLKESLAALSPAYDQLAAFDYVLEPGAERLLMRVSLVNRGRETIDLGVDRVTSDELLGFFQSNQFQRFTPEHGFDDTLAEVSWVGFVNGSLGYAYRAVDGPLSTGIKASGFQLFHAPGFVAESCGTTTLDRLEIIAGGPELDGLREAMRRVDGEPPWRAIDGSVTDASGAPIGEAWVHALDADGSYLSRTRSDAQGRYTIHAPPDRSVRLVAQARGRVHAGVDVAPASNNTTLAFEAHGTLDVRVVDSASGTPLPARVQVIPAAAREPTPVTFGVPDEAEGRLHQAFAVDGTARLVVPPGDHRGPVTRGFEFELFDQTVSVGAGESTALDAALLRSVDSTGIMCGDFHVHANMSLDSFDTPTQKVSSAAADGLEIVCASEHEWVTDFVPAIAAAGLGDWTFSMPSAELTTFWYGHFGVIPQRPRPGSFNNGAIDWIGKLPGEVFAEIRTLDERPAIIVNHPSSGGFFAYFSSALFDPATGVGRDEQLWSDNFDGLEIFNDSSFDDNRDGSVADWFSLLNHGKRVFAIGSSDSHSVRSDPVGYPRTCLGFGHDDPSKLDDLAVRDALLSANISIAGGMLMTVAGPAGGVPGSELPAAGSNRFDLVVQAPSWIEADSLEVIVNGATVSEQPLTPLAGAQGNRYELTVDVDVPAGGWVLFHARGKGDMAPLHPGRSAFAVANPFFAP
jgi:hypothetical protein